MPTHKAKAVVSLGYIEVPTTDANARSDGLLPAVEREIKSMDDAEIADMVRKGFDTTIHDETRIVSSYRPD